ncbi:MAG: GNAT family N-acetyltransferase [Candidatus Bipolaricaulis sp.]|nr:GNAT family N-acetyltransferase [Candidatus Bipolaricaulis sp.]
MPLSAAIPILVLLVAVRHGGATMKRSATSNQLSIGMEATKEEQDFVEAQLARHNQEATGGRFSYPGQGESGLAFDLVVRDQGGRVAGGVSVSSVLGVMWLEVLYVADEFRRRGAASWLVLEAERLAHEKGCIGAGTWTFNWQGPEFYPTIGYELRGIYTGYPFGVTEHVLAKRLPDGTSAAKTADRIARLRHEGFTLLTAPSEDDMRVVGRGFHQFCTRNAGEEMDTPGIGVRLALKDPAGHVVGGLGAFTTIRNMVLETIWIDERFRGRGHGRRLLLEAERIAKEAGCSAVSTHCLSFQSPEFFHKLGYATYGVVDVAVDGHTEDLLIKRL